MTTILVAMLLVGMLVVIGGGLHLLGRHGDAVTNAAAMGLATVVLLLEMAAGAAVMVLGTWLVWRGAAANSAGGGVGIFFGLLLGGFGCLLVRDGYRTMTGPSYRS
jgi:hypothetical protein